MFHDAGLFHCLEFLLRTVSCPTTNQIELCAAWVEPERDRLLCGFAMQWEFKKYTNFLPWFSPDEDCKTITIVHESCSEKHQAEQAKKKQASTRGFLITVDNPATFSPNLFVTFDMLDF